jgi:hypothetical protein
VLVRVIYKNNVYDMMKPTFVDRLIKSGKIKMFLRSEGWVVVGHDRTRTKNESFKGPDRREKSTIF